MQPVSPAIYILGVIGELMEEKWLVCGTRGKSSKKQVEETLDRFTEVFTEVVRYNYSDKTKYPDCIIHGDCPNSADKYADDWAKENGVQIRAFPATKGTFLKRNIQMVSECTRVIAFWDGFSYGTAHTIATAAEKNIPVYVIRCDK